MKFRLTFKTPDVTDQLDAEDQDDDNIQAVVSKFVKYGELIIIEFDTEKKTAKVVEV